MTAGYTILADWWRANGDEPARAMTAETHISKLEQRYQVKLPDDFRGYLLNYAPEMDFLDSEGTSWWSLSRIRNIPEEYEYEIKNLRIADNAHNYLFFADFSIWCWAWAICCDFGEDRGKVGLIGGDGEFVATSFTAFVAAYTNDLWSVC